MNFALINPELKPGSYSSTASIINYYAVLSCLGVVNTSSTDCCLVIYSKYCTKLHYRRVTFQITQNQIALQYQLSCLKQSQLHNKHWDWIVLNQASSITFSNSKSLRLATIGSRIHAIWFGYGNWARYVLSDRIQLSLFQFPSHFRPQTVIATSHSSDTLYLSDDC